MLSLWSGRVWGEIKSAIGDDEAIKLHNNAAALNTDLNLAATRILKIIQGSRPSDFDLKFYLDNMPKITDRPELARKKANIIRERFVNDYNKVMSRLKSRGYSDKQLGAPLEHRKTVETKTFNSDMYLGE